MIPLWVGYDPREAAAFHTFNQSVIETASQPVAIYPLALRLLRDYSETHVDGSNAFIYSRFLIPHLSGFNGFAIFCDGDMLVREDIAQLWALRDDRFAVQVVKHQYTTKHKRKYVGSSMETHNMDYPRKNWSSVMIWNCGHHRNRTLTPEFVMQAKGSQLHRFEHLRDDEIGGLPMEWNWLVGEYDHNPQAKIAHFTLGVPAIDAYADAEHGKEWFQRHYETGHVEL